LRIVAGALLGATVMVLTAATPAPDADAESAHPSGLVLVGKAAEEGQIPDAVSATLGRAERLAEQNPHDFGYAWFDHDAKKVVLDVVSSRGGRMAQTLGRAGVEDVPAEKLDAESLQDAGADNVAAEKLDAESLQVAGADDVAAEQRSVRKVERSQSRLEQLKHDVIDIGGEPAFDADGIWQSEVDRKNNRVILTVTRLSDALAAEIVHRYGRSDVAVRVDRDRPDSAPLTRDADTSPFWGGARINVPGAQCTDAFSWFSGSTSYLLTAGHCVPTGGSVSTPATSVGSVTSGSRENWTSGTGTVYLTGSTTYRGDIALIQVAASKSSSRRMYRGDTTSTTSAAVGEMWSRRAASGDSYCTGGAFSGEICGWTVGSVGVDSRYSTGETIRNAITSRNKKGWCMRPGDSGGSVYTVRGDGKIAAKGITSGGGGGRSDYYGGQFDQCSHTFTDIYEAYHGFRGSFAGTDAVQATGGVKREHTD